MCACYARESNQAMEDLGGGSRRRGTQLRMNSRAYGIGCDTFAGNCTREAELTMTEYALQWSSP